MERLLLGDGQRVSYSLMGPRGNPVMESFFARFKGENRDLFMEAKDVVELKGVIEERLRYYHETAFGARVQDAQGGMASGPGGCTQ